MSEAADEGPPGPEDLSDEELVELLRVSPHDGPMWAFFRARVLRVVIVALHHRVLRGETMFAPGGRFVILFSTEQEELRRDQDARDDLVVDAAVQYLELVSARLGTDRGWSADGGASLDTYAVNGALFVFAARVQARRRHRGEDARFPLRDPDDLPTVSVDGPEQLLVAAWNKYALVAEIQRFDPLVLDAILRRFDTGETWAEIADGVGLSEKALEHRRRKCRRWLKDKLA